MLIKGHRVGGAKPRGHIVGFGGVPVAPLVQRYYTETKAAGGQYYSLSSAVTLGTLYEFEANVLFISAGGHLLCNNISGASFDRVAISNTGAVYLASNNMGTLSDITSLTDNRMHNFRFVMSGAQTKVYVDGVLLLTSGVAIPTLNINKIGNTVLGATGLPTFSGIISDVKIWTDGDRNTGTLIVDMPLDEDGTSSVAVNKAAVLGSELYSFGNVGSIETGVSVTQDGEDAFIVNTTTDDKDRAYVNFTTEVGETYRLLCRRDDISGTTNTSTIFARDGINGGGTVLNSVQLPDNTDIALNFTATSTTSTILFDISTNVAPLSRRYGDIELRKINTTTPYATRINLTSADTELFTQDSNGDWLGEEISGWLDNPLSMSSTKNVNVVGDVLSRTPNDVCYVSLTPIVYPGGPVKLETVIKYKKLTATHLAIRLQANYPARVDASVDLTAKEFVRVAVVSPAVANILETYVDEDTIKLSTVLDVFRFQMVSPRTDNLSVDSTDTSTDASVEITSVRQSIKRLIEVA